MSKVYKIEELTKEQRKDLQLGQFEKVSNLEHDYKKAVNQFVIEFECAIVFQSYSTIIAIKHTKSGTVYLSESWACSRTTSRHRSRFLGETTAETKAKIKSGQYVVVAFKRGLFL